MRICKSCGAELKPEDKFCLECGSAADDTEQTGASEKKENILPIKELPAKPAPIPEIKKLPEMPPIPEIKELPKSEDAEKEKEDIVEETIEKAEEAACAKLPQVKQINIIKPKDISVLKPQRSVPAVKKTAAAATKPLPTAAELKRMEEEKNLPPLPETHKKEVPEVELPKEPKMEYYAKEDSSNIVAKSFVDKRTDDFSNGFYSDVKKNEEERKAAAVSAASSKRTKKKKSSPIGTIFVILLILAVIGGFVYYFLFIMPGQSAASDDPLSVEISDTTNISDVSEVSDTSADISAAETISLEFTHNESVSGSEILTYDFGGENFDINTMTENSEILVEYTTTATIADGMAPIIMTLSDGAASVTVTESGVSGNTVSYSFSDIKGAVPTGDISSVQSMTFRGKGMSVDISSISITNCK